MNRLQSNIKILDILKQLAYEFPGLRFHQLLMYVQLELTGTDPFYEESEVTLEKLRSFIQRKREFYDELHNINIY